MQLKEIRVKSIHNIEKWNDIYQLMVIIGEDKPVEGFVIKLTTDSTQDEIASALEDLAKMVREYK